MATTNYQSVVQPVNGAWNLGGYSATATFNAICVLTAAAENYEAALSDALNSVLVPPPPGSGLKSVLTDLTTLMTYFYYGMSKSLETSVLPTESKQRRLKALLDLIKVELELLLYPAPFGQVPISFPNCDVVELLVKIKFYSAVGARPASIGALFDVLSRTELAQLELQRNGDEIWSSGLPAVVFPCLGHAPQLVVGVSAATWSGFKRVWDCVRGWRMERFKNPLHDATDIQNAGDLVNQRFGDFCDANRNMITRFRDPATISQATAGDWNVTISTIFDLLYNNGNGRAYAFNHAGELGRPFHGNGPAIFTPMTRCWKCRFVHLYTVNDANITTVAREAPSDTAFAANKPKSCAEDLCHYFCSQLLHQTAALQLPAIPILP